VKEVAVLTEEEKEEEEEENFSLRRRYSGKELY